MISTIEKKKRTIHFYFCLTSESDYFTLFFFSDKNKNKTKHFHRSVNIFLVIENCTASHKVPCLPNANQISFLR